MMLAFNATNSSMPPVPIYVMKNFRVVINAKAYAMIVVAMHITLLVVKNVRKFYPVDTSVTIYVVRLACHVKKVAKPNVYMAAVTAHVENHVTAVRNHVPGSASMSNATRSVGKTVIVVLVWKHALSPCYVATDVLVFVATHVLPYVEYAMWQISR